MSEPTADALPQALLAALPADGSAVGNIALRKQLTASLGTEVSEASYAAARDALVAAGHVAKGQGRGGSVRLVLDGAAAPTLTLQAPEKPAGADMPRPRQAGMALGQRQPGQPARAKARANEGEKKLAAYHHRDQRTNNPEVGLVTPDDDPDQPKTRWAYDPHIDPALQFDSARAQVENLIDDALASGDAAVMRAALAQLKQHAAPYLNWSGKAERTSFEVDTVSLHVHERIDPATVLGRIKKQLAKGKGGVADAPQQQDWLRAWFDRPLPLREAIEFYKHDRGWANRLIAGDSLLVMNSLLEKESLAGQVQMIYIDPPYGIKYGSNFQPFVNKRDVKDRKDEDLTQEPEMIKAFRDTWELGIHSYLTYLRDRLLLAKELLHESGSVFVQISDENLHHVREIMDELFGAENLAGLIPFKKTSGQASTLIAGVCDYLVWYVKNKGKAKYRQLYATLGSEVSDDSYNCLLAPNGSWRRLKLAELRSGEILSEGRRFRTANLTSQGESGQDDEFASWGQSFLPSSGTHWKPGVKKLPTLQRAGRLMGVGQTLAFKRFANDFPVVAINNMWSDTVESTFVAAKMYVVQTSAKVIERCLLMTTDPGDLVLDPTCGSGTTAFVAEKWGRRWITCDTSRVAVTLAKQRLMTASYDYFDLKYPHEGLKSGFIYKTVPHVTLKSIANNPEIDAIYERLQPAIEAALQGLNAALRAGKAPAFVVTEGGRKGKLVDFAAPIGQTVALPSGEQAPAGALLVWEVPFDFPAGWPQGARAAFDAFHAARQALQQAMDRSIAAHADQETLYDQPEVSKTRLRVTGPFTVEAVPFPSVAALDESTGTQSIEADASIARSGESARQHGWRDELMRAGIRGKGGQMLRFATLETLPGMPHLHVTGTLADSGDRVVVSFGPEYAALEQRQVEMAMREASELFPRPKMIVFAAFTFDPEAAKDIDNTKGIIALKAQMNTDLLTEDLKKKQRGNQSFWLMGQPDVELRQRKDGRFEVEVHGFDYFDTAKGDLVSGGRGKIAMWSLDTDYDERSLFPTQVFFPMAGKKDGWEKLKKNIKAELDETLLPKLHGALSLPFEAGANRKVAVKIVDDRGIESLKVIPLP